MSIKPQVLQQATEHARRFKWGFDNATFGSDDWRCGAHPFSELGLDDNDDPMVYDDGPCECPECAGATARMFSKKMPLSVRVALNLAGVA